MTTTSFLSKDSIATQLIKAVFLFYCIIALIITLTQVIIEYQYTEKEIQNELAINQKIFEPVLSASLWNVDKEQIQNTINGMLAIPIISGIKIEQDSHFLTATGIIHNNDAITHYDENGLPQQTKVANSNDLYSFQFPVNYEFRGKNKLVGVATIYSNSTVVVERVKMGIILLIINSVLKTISLWVIFFWVGKRILLKPLNNLVETIKSVNFKKIDQVNINLENTKTNELTIIENAFTDMVYKLVEARNDVLNSHLILEDKVKQRTSELELAKTEAVLANKTKTEFMSRISHEFNTPLNAIVGGTDVLNSLVSNENTDQKYLIDNIKIAANHLNMLVKDIMDVVQSSKYEFHIELKSCNLDKIIESCITMVQPILDTSKITIIYIPQPIHVYANEGRVRQIILHILTNAILYNKLNGNVEISINIPNSQFVAVHIEDSGVGISQNDLERIFMPFSRLQHPKDRCIDGLGIGLSLSKALIENMHGNINVSSKEGVGSTFIVSFLSKPVN